MNYATGHSFNLDHLFLNFNTNKLKIDSISLNILYKDKHKKVFAKKVFKECCRIVLNDIIDNDVEFQLPTGKKRTSLLVKQIPEKEFKECRKNGKYKDIDYLTTFFKTYDLKLFMYGNRDLAKTKNVYLNKELKQKLINNINSGKVYYGKTIKTIKDYYEDVNKLYPYIPLSDIIKILNFGWKSLYLHNSYGGDTLITDNTLWFYIGSLYKDSLKYFNYYVKKLTLKIRILTKRIKVEWDGYYYFSLTDSLYALFIEGKGKKGRPKKYFTFEHIYCYKWFDECNIKEHSRKYIMRMPALYDLGDYFYNAKYKVSNVELFLERQPLKFKDILTSNYDYMYL